MLSTSQIHTLLFLLAQQRPVMQLYGVPLEERGPKALVFRCFRQGACCLEQRNCSLNVPTTAPLIDLATNQVVQDGERSRGGRQRRGSLGDLVRPVEAATCVLKRTQCAFGPEGVVKLSDLGHPPEPCETLSLLGGDCCVPEAQGTRDVIVVGIAMP
jgi:hypothetical protein